MRLPITFLGAVLALVSPASGEDFPSNVGSYDILVYRDTLIDMQNGEAITNWGFGGVNINCIDGKLWVTLFILGLDDAPRWKVGTKATAQIRVNDKPVLRG